MVLQYSDCPKISTFNSQKVAGKSIPCLHAFTRAPLARHITSITVTASICNPVSNFPSFSCFGVFLSVLFSVADLRFFHTGFETYGTMPHRIRYDRLERTFRVIIIGSFSSSFSASFPSSRSVDSCSSTHRANAEC